MYFADFVVQLPLKATVVGHRLGHSPIQAVHNMLCTAWIGGCPNLKTVSQSMTHNGTELLNTWIPGSCSCAIRNLPSFQTKPLYGSLHNPVYFIHLSFKFLTFRPVLQVFAISYFPNNLRVGWRITKITLSHFWATHLQVFQRATSYWRAVAVLSLSRFGPKLKALSKMLWEISAARNLKRIQYTVSMLLLTTKENVQQYVATN